MARGGQPENGLNWPLAKRFYRFVANPRFDHRALLKGLYGLAQQAVARDPRPYLVVAIDAVNFEKPYTADLEGVSTVLKSTPPGPKGEKRLTPGYPAITATIVNLPEPVTPAPALQRQRLSAQLQMQVSPMPTGSSSLPISHLSLRRPNGLLHGLHSYFFRR